jgi:hypothetical protein
MKQEEIGQMIFRTMLNGTLACLLMLAASIVVATEDGTTKRLAELEEEVAALRAAVAALRQAEASPADRLAEIERKIGIIAAELEDLKVGESVVKADQPVAGFAPAASKVYHSPGGVSLGGYGEWLYQRFDERREDGTGAAETDSFDALRGILYVGYKFNDRWLLNTEIEYEHASTGKSGEVSLEFAYLDYLYRPQLGFRAGLLLMPMGFINELHEPTTFLGANRPETERRIIPTTWRENGAGIFGELGDFSYRTYLVTGFKGEGFSSSGLRGGRQKGSKAKAEDFAWVGRLDYAAAPGLTLGLSAFIGDSGQDLETPDGRDLGVRTTIWEGHGEWRYRGIELRGLYARATVDDVRELNQALGLTGSASVGETMEGYYLQAGYDLLAHHHGDQSLIPFIRWESVNTQAAVPAGFTINPANHGQIFTLGLTYKPLTQIVIKLDYQKVSNRADTGVDQINAALGYIF